MKLLCLNVCQFEANNSKLKDFLSDTQYDIVCLQEVTRATDGKAKPEYVSYETINKTLNLSYGFFAPIWVLERFYKTNFHGQDLFDFNLGGYVEFGNYLRSRYKIAKGQNIFLQNHLTYITNWDNWPQEDYRGIQVVDLEVSSSKKLRVMNYHGIWSKNKIGNTKTTEACKRIRDIALEVSYPSIICGDFNLFPETKSMEIFNSDFTNLLNTYKIQTTRPESNELSNEHRNVVDYVLVSKGVKVNYFEVIKSDVSDHLPLLLDFEI